MRLLVLRTVCIAILCSVGPPLFALQQDEQSQPPAQAPSTSQPQDGSKPAPGQIPVPQNEPSPPTQAQPEQSPVPAPPQSQAPVEEKPAPPPNSSTGNAQPSAPKPPTAATKSKTVRKKRKPVAKTQRSSPDGKVVVRNGGASEGTAQISPGMSDEQAQRQREATSQLLAATDANVKRVSGKQLTTMQQGMLDQINSYVRQSKAASDSGDLSRARTLAFKAQLLSDELARK